MRLFCSAGPIEVLHCAESHFTCVNDSACIPKSQTCNGHPNCADGSDESADTCGEWVCSLSTFLHFQSSLWDGPFSDSQKLH